MPTYPLPKRQVKANPRIIVNRGGNHLEHGSLLLLQQVLHDDAVVMVQQDVFSNDDEDDVPLLVGEMVVEDQ